MMLGFQAFLGSLLLADAYKSGKKWVQAKYFFLMFDLLLLLFIKTLLIIT